jgi:hypothetical protein
MFRVTTGVSLTPRDESFVFVSLFPNISKKALSNSSREEEKVKFSGMYWESEEYPCVLFPPFFRAFILVFE